MGPSHTHRVYLYKSISCPYDIIKYSFVFLIEFFSVKSTDSSVSILSSPAVGEKRKTFAFDYGDEEDDENEVCYE